MLFKPSVLPATPPGSGYDGCPHHEIPKPRDAALHRGEADRAGNRAEESEGVEGVEQEREAALQHPELPGASVQGCGVDVAS